MRRSAVHGTATSLLALALASQAQAQGYGVYEHDACAMARSGTGVAAPCGGGSAVFFNPAGVVGSATAWSISAGGTLITLDFNYRDSITGRSTDAAKNLIPVPSAYVTRQLGDRLAVGLGVYAPYGLIVEWPTTFEGRFLAYRSDLAAAYVQPTLAYRAAPWLRIGAGLTYAHTRVELKQRVDLSSQNTTTPGVTFAMIGVPTGTDFADATVSGSGNSIGGHFGVIVEPTPRISIGARYLLAMDADIEGDAAFTQVSTGITLPRGNPIMPGGAEAPLDAVLAGQFTGSGLLTAQGVTTTIPLPAQFVIGVAFKATPRLTLLADYQRTMWKQFDSLVLDFATLPDRVLHEDYRNTNGFRFGAEFRGNRVTFRGGYLFHSAAAPAQTVTPLLPEGERSEVTAGIGIPISPRIRLDLAYQFIQQGDRRGRVVEPTAPGAAGVSANSGLYTGTANLFGASFALGF